MCETLSPPFPPFYHIMLIFKVYIMGKYKNIFPMQLVKVHWVGERQRIEWKEFSVCMVWSDYTVCLVVLKKLFSFQNLHLQCHPLLNYKIDCWDLAETGVSPYVSQYNSIFLVCVAISCYPFGPK